MNRPAVAWVLAWLVVGPCSPARAEQDLKPGLNWVRLAGARACPSAPEIAQAVEARLGRPLFVNVREAELFVDGYVARAGDGFDVSLEISDGKGAVLGRRSLHVAGEQCDVITEAVTLVMAVTLYPDSALPAAGIPLAGSTAARLDALFSHEPLDPDPGALPGPPPVQSAAAAAGAAPAAVGGRPVPRRSDPLAVSIAGSATLGVGQLPGLSLGAAAQVTLRARRSWPAIQLALSYFLPRTARVEGSAAHGSFQLLLGSLSVCPPRLDTWATLELCLGAEVGQLRVTAAQFRFDNREAADLIANARAEGAWYLALSAAWSLRLGLVLSVPLVQQTYSYRASDGTSRTLFRIPQAALRGQLGLAYEF